MVKYRNRMIIAAAILEIAAGGAKRTRLMYGALVSYSQLVEYLDVLTSRGLLDYSAIEKKYQTTEKGLSLIKTSEALQGMIEPKKNLLAKEAIL